MRVLTFMGGDHVVFYFAVIGGDPECGAEIHLVFSKPTDPLWGYDDRNAVAGHIWS